MLFIFFSSRKCLLFSFQNNNKHSSLWQSHALGKGVFCHNLLEVSMSTECSNPACTERTFYSSLQFTKLFEHLLSH